MSKKTTGRSGTTKSTAIQPAANLTVPDSVRPHRLQPGFLNVDLTAIKKFGKWQLGPVAFGPTDLTRPVASYQKQSQFAAGGLVGYDFSQLTMQAYATDGFGRQNYDGRDTRVWF